MGLTLTLLHGKTEKVLGKPFERLGRKAMGLQTFVYDCQVACITQHLGSFFIWR